MDRTKYIELAEFYLSPFSSGWTKYVEEEMYEPNPSKKSIMTKPERDTTHGLSVP